MSERPYSRIYWEVMDDPKFDGVREDMRHFGAWALLLLVADMSHPASAFIPAAIPRASLRILTAHGLVELLAGGRYRIHGLDKERAQRSDKARASASVRWSDRTPNAMRSHSDGNAGAMLDETRQDKTSIARGIQSKTTTRDPNAAAFDRGVAATQRMLKGVRGE